MRILAFDTSTRQGGVALLNGDAPPIEILTDQQRSHSELLNSFTDSALEQAHLRLSDIDLFAVDRGPGSFTGLRVAGNVAKTFAYITQKPLVALESLTILAGELKPSETPALVLINAFKNMVYYGIYDVRGETPLAMSAPAAATVPEILPLITTKMRVVGDAWPLFKDQFASVHSLLDVQSEIVFPRPQTLARLAKIEAKNGRVLSWNDFTPLYLRASEAEENMRKRLFLNDSAKEQVNGKTR